MSRKETPLATYRLFPGFHGQMNIRSRGCCGKIGVLLKTKVGPAARTLIAKVMLENTIHPTPLKDSIAGFPLLLKSGIGAFSAVMCFFLCIHTI
ncbi:hypothetical protein K440DRAFT_253506 [Wilcoxina mikolae CBS 423.85]|nr:hypothetical protein K440DRAFT_253506 [Wilcoxina mikolae CBS 423.85]